MKRTRSTKLHDDERFQSEESGGDDQGIIDSDALDDEPRHIIDDRWKKKTKKQKMSDKSTTASTSRSTPKRSKRKSNSKRESDNEDEFELGEGQEVVGKVVQAPTTGLGALILTCLLFTVTHSLVI
jgi:hypothetical protein